MINTIRTIIVAGLLTGVSISLSAQTKFQIKGNLKDTSRNGEKVFLNYFNGEKKVYTTSIVKDGAFTFEGTVMEPSRAVLSISTKKEDR